MTTRENSNAINHDKEVKMMKRMECKLSQDIRVEARHHQRTNQDRSRIVVQTLLVQE